MAERRRPQRQDGRAHLRIRDDLDAEDVCEARAAVVAECAEDEVFTFLVEYEDAGDHGEVSLAGLQFSLYRLRGK